MNKPRLNWNVEIGNVGEFLVPPHVCRVGFAVGVLRGYESFHQIEANTFFSSISNSFIEICFRIALNTFRMFKFRLKQCWTFHGMDNIWFFCCYYSVWWERNASGVMIERKKKCGSKVMQNVRKYWSFYTFDIDAVHTAHICYRFDSIYRCKIQYFLLSVSHVIIKYTFQLPHFRETNI